MIKELLIFTAGAAIGGVVAWQILKKEYQMEAQEEIESMERHYKEKYGEVEKNDIPKEESQKPIHTHDKVDEDLFKSIPRDVYKNYGNKDDRLDISSSAEREFPTEDRPEPYIIPYSQWESNDNSYDQVSVTYYYGDKQLIEDDGRPHPDDEIDEMGGFKLDISDTVGIDNLKKFDDEGVLYIRNERYGIDYEVCLDPRSYSEDVLGKFGY